MSKLLPIETIAGLSKVKEVDDPLFQGWLERIARNTEQQSRLLRAVPTGTASPQAPASELVVNGDSLTGITAAAAEIWVKDIEGNPEVLTGFGHFITFNDALDAEVGTLSPSTWYYLWLIYNGVTSRLLISKSSTIPLMPSGYTHKGLLTAMRINGSSALVRFFTQGRHTSIAEVQVLNAGAATAATAVSLVTAAPPIGRIVGGKTQINDTGSAARFLDITFDSSRGGQLIQTNSVSAGNAGGNFRVAYDLSQIFYFTAASTNRANISITSWEF